MFILISQFTLPIQKNQESSFLFATDKSLFNLNFILFDLKQNYIFQFNHQHQHQLKEKIK